MGTKFLPSSSPPPPSHRTILFHDRLCKGISKAAINSPDVVKFIKVKLKVNVSEIFSVFLLSGLMSTSNSRKHLLITPTRCGSLL
jgi:hypothetical protein